VSSAWRNALIVGALAVAASTAGLADFDPVSEPEMKADYDGRFAFTRIRVGLPLANYRMQPPWAHDYARADFHFLKILNEITFVRTFIDQGNVMTLDDPDLGKFPIAYLSEPGYWRMTEAEAAGLRNYLLKGGFIIFDDFRSQANANLFVQMRYVLPDAVWQPLDASNPIFHSFFEIKSLEVDSYYGRASWYGVFEDDDPHKRLMAVANSNHDLGEYWEFSDTGFFPVDLSNDAYKFGVNYIVYGMTH
jgi:hypothetical protein